MSCKKDDTSGCGCLVVILLVLFISQGFWEGVALLVCGWLRYLIFVGVTRAIIKDLFGD